MTRRHLGLVVAVLAPALTSCGGGDGAGVTDLREERPMTIRLQSPAFEEGGAIPGKYTCDGEDVSPPLAWSGVPDSARSLALICDDPDAPRGTWTHWVLFDLPPGAPGLPEGIPPEGTARVEVGEGGGGAVARQGTNDFRKLGYGGPCPPSGTHRYFFRLYALDGELGLEPGAPRQQVLRAMEGHILEQGELMGRYQR